jgi:hypothetical protein
VAIVLIALPTYAQNSSMGPKDIADIPIESVPDWVSDGMMRPSAEPTFDPEIEVLAVLKDPRDVPLERFLYALTDQNEVIVHPQAEAIRRVFGDEGHSAVAVYVRARAPSEICEDCYERDPFYIDSLEFLEKYPGPLAGPWTNLGVAYNRDGVSVLPCLEPMTIEKGVRSFRTPDTHEFIQPDEYLPPLPQYTVKDNTNTGLPQGSMTENEIREGWVLCLAPNVPANKLRIVTALNEPSGEALMTGFPLWAPLEELAVGEWVLLENRQVSAWNEGPPQTRGGDPIRLDEKVVYEGDVWVSVTQGLRHLLDTQTDEGLQEFFTEELRLQLYFEGMDELLLEWDQLELKDGLEFTLAGTVQNLIADRLTQDVEDFRAQGARIIVYGESINAREPKGVLWVYPGAFTTGEGAGPLYVWRVEFQESDERQLSTASICEVAECVTIPIGPIDEEVDTPIPVIPFGSKAYGITVKNARFVQYPVMNTRHFDIYIEDTTFDDEQMLVVDIKTNSSFNKFASRRKTNCGRSLGYDCFGNEWATFARSGEMNLVLTDDDVLIGTSIDKINFHPLENGPVFKLR